MSRALDINVLEIVVSRLKQIEQSELVQEDQHDADGSKIADDEAEYRIQWLTQCAAIGDFVPYLLLVNHPSQEDADEETAYWHEELGYKIVEQVEEAHSENLHFAPYAKRQ